MGKDSDPYDDLKILESVPSLAYSKDLHRNQALRNPLYYNHFFKYRGGDLLRAILGREIIYDREWENDFISLLDKVLQSKENSCRVWRYVGLRKTKLRAPFWRHNGWLPKTGASGYFSNIPLGSLRLDPDEKDLFFTRRIGNLIDVEGPIFYQDGEVRNGTLTFPSFVWENRYRNQFREVRLENGDERSGYQFQSDGVDSTDRKSRRTTVERDPSDHKGNNDLLLKLQEADRVEKVEEAKQSLRALSSFVRVDLVSRPWRVSSCFRGSTVDDFYLKTTGSPYKRKNPPISKKLKSKDNSIEKSILPPAESPDISTSVSDLNTVITRSNSDDS